MTEDNWIPITAKFHSACIECLCDIEEGDQILWLKGRGTKHKVCTEPIHPTFEVEAEEDYSKWIDPKVYTYKETQKISKCQKCNGMFSTNRFLESTEQGYRAICEVCFGGH